MIPTMLAVGLVVGLLPRWWPHNVAAVAGIGVLVSLAFGLLVGEPLGGGALALANTAIGVGLGRTLQLVVPPPGGRTHGAA